MTSAPIIAIGDSAEHLLVAAEKSQFSVRCMATFERSLYIEFRSPYAYSVLCVATTEIPCGPITAIVTRSDFQTLLDSPIFTNGQWLDSPITHWLDPRVATVWNSQLIAGALGVLPEPQWLSALLSHHPSESLVHYCDESTLRDTQSPASGVRTFRGSLFDAQQDYFQTTVRQVEQSLQQLLLNNDASGLLDERLAAPLVKLAGAGSGMTPAGDDALAGVFIALRLLDKQCELDWLQHIVLPKCSTRTHAISNALLREAAAGRTDESMHCVIHNMSHAQLTTVQHSATLLSGMGQTSGWDCLAGMLLVFRAADPFHVLSTVQLHQSSHA